MADIHPDIKGGVSVLALRLLYPFFFNDTMESFFNDTMEICRYRQDAATAMRQAEL